MLLLKFPNLKIKLNYFLIFNYKYNLQDFQCLKIKSNLHKRNHGRKKKFRKNRFILKTL